MSKFKEMRKKASDKYFEARDIVFDAVLEDNDNILAYAEFFTAVNKNETTHNQKLKGLL